jgi:hypothetical protein
VAREERRVAVQPALRLQEREEEERVAVRSARSARAAGSGTDGGSESARAATVRSRVR